MSKITESIIASMNDRGLDIVDELHRKQYTTIMGSDGAGLMIAITSRKEDLDLVSITVEDVMGLDHDEYFTFIDGEDITDRLGKAIDKIISKAEK